MLNKKIQDLRIEILEILYKNRADFIVKIEDLVRELGNIPEKELHQEIKYLEGKGYLEIKGSFCGKEYLYFSGLTITSLGVDVFENKDDKYIWPFIYIDNKIDAKNSNISVNSKKVNQKAKINGKK
jgi:hypothetical protein